MKRILCLLLCLTLLLPVIPAARAEEALTFSLFRVDAGNGVYQESAIFHEGDAYIPAEHFSRYTRYRFQADTGIFVIKGQEASRAVKLVAVLPESKTIWVGDKKIKLSDCFTVDGVLYLPFCQLLPILNAEILAVEDGVVLVTNNSLSMAELLYDFRLSDYAYDLNAEFFDSEELLLAYTIPSYLFDSVTNFRFDRLDFIADSGTYKDYKEIFEGYLKDNTLYFRATGQKDHVQQLLTGITGLNQQTEFLSDTVDWLERLAARDIAFTQSETINQILDRKGLYSGYFERFGVDAFPISHTVHDDTYVVSIADLFEIVDYIYSYCNQTEDHFRMLDAVYDFEAGDDFEDTQRRGAQAVYDLYGDREWYGILKETADKLFEKALEDSTYGGEFVLYQLTAKLSGELWELVIPGDTGDVSSLTLHAGVADSARAKAAIGSFETEESTRDYRLCLLLMMLASRKCYEIMADTAESYGSYNGDYLARIQRLEDMIQALYLVAGNVRLDTFEYFGDYAAENRELLAQAGIFDAPVPAEPDDMGDPEDRLYLSFLSQHPEYNYYALVDVNQDGTMELLASEDNGNPHSYIDLWILDGDFRLGWEDIWAKYDPIAYSPTNRWIVTQVGGTGGMGYWFYSLDENLTVRKQGVEYYDFCGYIYNDREINGDAALLNAWNALYAKHDQDPGTAISLSPIPPGYK